MGRKEGAAGRQRGTTSTTQAHTDGRRGGDFEQEKKKKKEEKKEEKKEKSTLRRARTRRRGFFFCAGGFGGRGAGAVEKVDGMGWELSGGGWRWFAVFWGGEPVAEGRLVPLVRMGSGGGKRGRDGGRGGAGRSTREGGGGHAAVARVCASEGVGRERLVPLVCMWIPLALSLSLCGVHRVCIFVNIASKLVASFDLRRVRTSPHGRGAEGRRDSGAG